MRIILVLSLMISPVSAWASALSVSEFGINSFGLKGPGGETLDGSGAKIGQVERLRPADPDIDDLYANLVVNPALVWVQQVNGTEDYLGEDGLTEADEMQHPTNVAGVMIAGGGGAELGVASGASLYSDAFVSRGAGESEPLKAIQKVWVGAGGGVRAINNSWGQLDETETVDGSSQITLGVDWMATRYDTLLVFAVNPTTSPNHDLPGDNFNGITVGSSERVAGGAWRQAVATNDVEDFYDSYHYEIDILAPGEDIALAGLGGIPRTSSGSSFAAPHVTGTVALLAQYAQLELDRPGTAWTEDAYHHEVFKAVILNSADKLAGVQGSTRTVRDAVFERPWDETNAFFDPEVPLDPYLGAGHLNAQRALAQYAAGPVTGADVADLGWHYGETAGFATLFSYPLAESFSGGYVSLTLAWDRMVAKFGGSENTYGAGDLFIDSGFNDLNLYLMPTGWQSLDDAAAKSVGIDDTVEHIFAQVPAGSYEIVVEQAIGSDQKFGLAWWLGDGPPADVPGDFNHDGNVNDADLQTWKDGFGTTFDGADFLDWQRNYGTMSVAAVPEPSTLMLSVLGLAALCRLRQRRET